MSAPPPKPPKPPPKPPKPGESNNVAARKNDMLSPTEIDPVTGSSTSFRCRSVTSTTSTRKTSMKIDEALRESMLSLSRSVFTGSAIIKANLLEEPLRYTHDTAEKSLIAAERLSVLNNLFRLNHFDPSTDEEGAAAPSARASTNVPQLRTPLTGLLLREGYLLKKSRKGDDKVYGVLTSECFAYGKEEFRVTGPSTMEIRRVLPLTTTLVTENTMADTARAPGRVTAVTRVRELSEDEVLRGASREGAETETEKEDVLAQLFVLAKDKSFALQFLTREDRNEWFQDLTEACSTAQERAGKMYMSAAEMSPVWKQDKATAECEVCTKKFNIFFRRHHCRNCGKCVCENCLVEKIRIPALDPRNLYKVCSACSVKLKEERSYMR